MLNLHKSKMAASCHDEKWILTPNHVWYFTDMVLGDVEPISNAGFQFQNISKEQMILERQFVTYLYI